MISSWWYMIVLAYIKNELFSVNQIKGQSGVKYRLTRSGVRDLGR